MVDSYQKTLENPSRIQNINQKGEELIMMKLPVNYEMSHMEYNESTIK